MSKISINSMNNTMNNNNMKGENNMMKNAITSKSIDPKAYGLGLHRRFRNAVNNKVHAVKFVINRVEIVYNKQTKQYDELVYKAIIDDSPLVREFGFDADYRAVNVKVFELNDEDERSTARRINIDGQKYIWCDSLISIEASDKKKIAELADKGYTLDVTKYMAATASPSNEKHACKYYAKMIDGMTEEDIFNKIDKLMGGALRYNLCHDLIDGKAIGKSNTRIGNYASGMQCLSKIRLAVERVAVVKGSIFQAFDFDEETLEAMEKAGVEINNHINDGAAFLNPIKVMEMAASVGVKLTEEAALRICVQTRWDVLNTKVMAQCKREDILEDMAAFYGAKIYGNPNGPLVALVDEDGAKMINWAALEDNNTVINMYVMAVANQSGVQSCGQHLIKYLNVDTEATLATIEKLATMAVDEFVMGRIESDVVAGYSVNSHIMAKLSPEEIVEDSMLLESIYAETITYIKTMISEAKISLDGVYTHMVFDTAYAITRGYVKAILNKTAEGFIEAYNPDVLRIYADEIKAIENNPELTDEEKEEQLFCLLSGTVIKFPSAMPDEYEIVVYQTYNQMMRKIDVAVAALDCSNETKEVIKDRLVDYIDHAAYGVTIYAPVNAMKNKLAGADIDYDATMCDMSELKFILINKRIEEAKQNPGYMGRCTVIKYGKVEPKEVVAEEAEEDDVLDVDNIEW